MSTIQVEACCDQIHSVAIAAQLGVDRIELCSALRLGGLTPDTTLFLMSQKIFPGPIHVLIRPREGGFVYSRSEKDIITESARFFLENGANGIVLGAAYKNTLDWEFLNLMRNTFPNTDITCHRVFDQVEDKKDALQKLVEVGFNRILTSGGGRSAHESIPLLTDLIEISNNQISIMPGAGINSGNVQSILNIPGVKEIHLSAKKSVRKVNHNSLLEHYEMDEIEMTKILHLVRQ